MYDITTLGTENSSNLKKQTIIFISEEHQNFYYKLMEEIETIGWYEKDILYTLGIDPITRAHVDEIFDFYLRNELFECMDCDWQTLVSRNVIRFAFDLYSNDIPTTQIDGSEYIYRSEELYYEIKKNSISELLSCDYALYFFQAIGLRFPEYMKWMNLNNKV